MNSYALTVTNVFANIDFTMTSVSINCNNTSHMAVAKTAHLGCQVDSE